MLSNIDITENEERLVIEKFSELKTERAKHIRKWKDIQDYVALTNEISSEFLDNENKSKQKDVYINDPTGFICTNQAGDYLAGILWNLEAITLEPSEFIKKSTNEDLSWFYKKATDKTLSQINSTDAGWPSILKSHCYEQVSFGTSGIGTYRSKEFDNEQSECCLSFKPYGVYNSCCDEGANNKINVVYSVYNWTINRIIEEFCIEDGEFSEELYKELPKEITSEYEANRLNVKKRLVYCVMPNNFYRMNKRGKVGAKFKGYWFVDNTKKIFKVDYFKEMPIAMGRFIRVNGQVYGESSGSIAISSIKVLNHVTGDTVDNIEKTTDAPVGVYSGALAAGNVINRSAGSVTVFNPQAAQGGQSPMFPISQIGDISAIVNFLLPELKKNIVNIFKIDQLLDFNNQTQMTATESSYRMSIRGKSINGIITQQKSEVIEPTVHRCISIIQECGLYGYDLRDIKVLTPEDIAMVEQIQEEKNFIPDVVARAMKDGKKWYSIKFNGELEKICNAELYDEIAKFLQFLTTALQIDPKLIHAINTYDLLTILRDASALVNDNLVKPKTEYKKLIEALEAEEKRRMDMQMALSKAQYAKDSASAMKDEAMANV